MSKGTACRSAPAAQPLADSMDQRSMRASSAAAPQASPPPAKRPSWRPCRRRRPSCRPPRAPLSQRPPLLQPQPPPPPGLCPCLHLAGGVPSPGCAAHRRPHRPSPAQASQHIASRFPHSNPCYAHTNSDWIPVLQITCPAVPAANLDDPLACSWFTTEGKQLMRQVDLPCIIAHVAISNTCRQATSRSTASKHARAAGL